MKRESIIFSNESDWLAARKHDLTSTDIADLFGVGRSSPFELWHRKKNLLDSDFEGNERSDWGTAFQDVIAGKLAADNGWNIRRMNEYIRIPELRIGSSFDFEIIDDDEDRATNGILEVKNVDSIVVKNDWLIGEDGEYESTPIIELQIQHQMLVSGHTYGFIGACIGGNKGVKLFRTAKSYIHTAILDRARVFWASIDSNTPPEPDYSRDAEFISSLYKEADADKVYDASVDHDIERLMNDYKLACESEKIYEETKKEIKARILDRIGDASKVIFPGGSISCGMIQETIVPEHTRKGYRSWRPYFKK